MSALDFAQELRQKIESLGGDVRQSDPDPIKRAKSVAFLFAVVAEAMHKIQSVQENKDLALESLRASYNHMIAGVLLQ